MLVVTHETEITGTTEAVWSALSDLSTFGAWNPVIQQVDGVLCTGHDVTIHVRVGTGLRPWMCHVDRVMEGREFAWSFVERSRFLYCGQHVFRVEPADNGRVRFIDRESFWGILVPFRAQRLRAGITASMSAMGHALKAHIESAGSTAHLRRDE